MDVPRPIGVYDSGLGGLTVVRRLKEQLPDEAVIYVGDTARVPYGGRSREEIICFSRQIMRFLEAKDVKIIVVACNTSSALALPVVSREFEISSIGMIGPAVSEALRSTRNGRIGLMATEATVNSGSYEKELQQKNPEAVLSSIGCPLLVPLIESGRFDSSEALDAVRTYVSPLKAAEVDTVILGCTHYPLLGDMIQREFGPAVRVLDPAESVVSIVKKCVNGNDSKLNSLPVPDEYYVSGNPESFEQNARRFGWDLKARHVDLDGF